MASVEGEEMKRAVKGGIPGKWRGEEERLNCKRINLKHERMGQAKGRTGNFSEGNERTEGRKELSEGRERKE